MHHGLREGVSRPSTSNLNYQSGVTTAISSIVDVGSSNRICVYSLSGGRLIIDLLGYQRV